MSARAQNGWPALERGSTKLHTWNIPARTGRVQLTLRNGSGGFLLALTALWFAECVEPLAGKILDDWGHAPRTIRGSSTTLSNHAAGLAFDANALQHVLGRRGTFTRRKTKTIRDRMRWAAMGGSVRWGGDYHNRADEMHFEVVKPLPACERIARRLMRVTPRGRRLIAANPGQRKVILS